MLNNEGINLAKESEVQETTSPRQSQRKPIVNRLKRASGQLTALIAAIENDADCTEVIMQLSAVSKAIDRAGFKILSTELQECVLNPDGEHDVEELERLFLSLA